MRKYQLSPSAYDYNLINYSYMYLSKAIKCTYIVQDGISPCHLMHGVRSPVVFNFIFHKVRTELTSQLCKKKIGFMYSYVLMQ